MERGAADQGTVDPSPRHPVPLSAYLIAICVVPVLIAAGFALVALSRHPDNESDRAAADELARRAPAVERAVADESERLERLATVLARDPKFYASLALPKADRGKREYRDAVESVLRDFQRDALTPIFAVTDERGALLSRALPPDEPTDLSKAPFVLDAVRGRPGHGVLIEMGMAYCVVAVPVTAGGVVVGSLCVGTALDADQAGTLKDAIGADVMFTIGESVASTTLAPSPIRKSIAQRIGDRSLDTSGLARPRPAAGDRTRPAPDVDVVEVSGARFLALHRSIDTPIAGGGPLGFVLIRPLESASSPLVLLRRDLWKASGAGLLSALLAGGAIAGVVFVKRRSAERAHEADLGSLEARLSAAESLLADVAPTLRDAAGSIATTASFLASPELGPLSQAQQEGMGSIARTAASLERTAQDLDDLGGLKRHALEPSLRPADVGALVERATVEQIPAAGRRRQALSFVAEPGLEHDRVDETLFQRAIESIVRQVLGTAPEGARVLIEAGRVEGAIAVAVGASAALPDSSAGSAEGLQVALARAIMEAHGGALHERDLGEGRRAYVLRLPPALPTAPPGSIATPQPAERETLPLAS
ncbi:MAG TPA: cache domain-containing protein [Candidatus Eisenbacteria bacterium]|nr:cache domain-containing protein [Candidatus Eisenbacteria bacterium]